MYDIIEKLFGEELEQARNEGIKEGEKRGEKTGIEKCCSIIRSAFVNKDIVSNEELSKKLDLILSELKLNSSSS